MFHEKRHLNQWPAPVPKSSIMFNVTEWLTSRVVGEFCASLDKQLSQYTLIGPEAGRKLKEMVNYTSQS